MALIHSGHANNRPSEFSLYSPAAQSLPATKDDVETGDVVRKASTVGADAGDAIETAMTVANVADGIEDVLDVVDVAQKLNNAREIIGRIPRR